MSLKYIKKLSTETDKVDDVALACWKYPDVKDPTDLNILQDLIGYFPKFTFRHSKKPFTNYSLEQSKISIELAYNSPISPDDFDFCELFLNTQTNYVDEKQSILDRAVPYLIRDLIAYYYYIRRELIQKLDQHQSNRISILMTALLSTSNADFFQKLTIILSEIFVLFDAIYLNIIQLCATDKSILSLPFFKDLLKFFSVLLDNFSKFEVDMKEKIIMSFLRFYTCTLDQGTMYTAEYCETFIDFINPVILRQIEIDQSVYENILKMNINQSLFNISSQIESMIPRSDLIRIGNQIIQIFFDIFVEKVDEVSISNTLDFIFLYLRWCFHSESIGFTTIPTPIYDLEPPPYILNYKFHDPILFPENHYKSDSSKENCDNDEFFNIFQPTYSVFCSFSAKCPMFIGLLLDNIVKHADLNDPFAFVLLVYFGTDVEFRHSLMAMAEKKVLWRRILNPRVFNESTFSPTNPSPICLYINRFLVQLCTILDHKQLYPEIFPPIADLIDKNSPYLTNHLLILITKIVKNSPLYFCISINSQSMISSMLFQKIAFINLCYRQTIIKHSYQVCSIITEVCRRISKFYRAVSMIPFLEESTKSNREAFLNLDDKQLFQSEESLNSILSLLFERNNPKVNDAALSLIGHGLESRRYQFICAFVCKILNQGIRKIPDSDWCNLFNQVINTFGQYFPPTKSDPVAKCFLDTKLFSIFLEACELILTLQSSSRSDSGQTPALSLIHSLIILITKISQYSRLFNREMNVQNIDQILYPIIAKLDITSNTVNSLIHATFQQDFHINNPPNILKIQNASMVRFLNRTTIGTDFYEPVKKVLTIALESSIMNKYYCFKANLLNIDSPEEFNNLISPFFLSTSYLNSVLEKNHIEFIKKCNFIIENHDNASPVSFFNLQKKDNFLNFGPVTLMNDFLITAKAYFEDIENEIVFGIRNEATGQSDIFELKISEDIKLSFKLRPHAISLPFTSQFKIPLKKWVTIKFKMQYDTFFILVNDELIIDPTHIDCQFDTKSILFEVRGSSICLGNIKFYNLDEPIRFVIECVPNLLSNSEIEYAIEQKAGYNHLHFHGVATTGSTSFCDAILSLGGDDLLLRLLNNIKYEDLDIFFEFLKGLVSLSTYFLGSKFMRAFSLFLQSFDSGLIDKKLFNSLTQILINCCYPDEIVAHVFLNFGVISTLSQEVLLSYFNNVEAFNKIKTVRKYIASFSDFLVNSMVLSQDNIKLFNILWTKTLYILTQKGLTLEDFNIIFSSIAFIKNQKFKKIASATLRSYFQVPEFVRGMKNCRKFFKSLLFILPVDDEEIRLNILYAFGTFISKCTDDELLSFLPPLFSFLCSYEVTETLMQNIFMYIITNQPVIRSKIEIKKYEIEFPQYIPLFAIQLSKLPKDLIQKYSNEFYNFMMILPPEKTSCLKQRNGFFWIMFVSILDGRRQEWFDFISNVIILMFKSDQLYLAFDTVIQLQFSLSVLGIDYKSYMLKFLIILNKSFNPDTMKIRKSKIVQDIIRFLIFPLKLQTNQISNDWLSSVSINLKYAQQCMFPKESPYDKTDSQYLELIYDLMYFCYFDMEHLDAIEFNDLKLNDLVHILIHDIFIDSKINGTLLFNQFINKLDLMKKEDLECFSLFYEDFSNHYIYKEVFNRYKITKEINAQVIEKKKQLFLNEYLKQETFIIDLVVNEAKQLKPVFEQVTQPLEKQQNDSFQKKLEYSRMQQKESVTNSKKTIKKYLHRCPKCYTDSQSYKLMNNYQYLILKKEHRSIIRDLPEEPNFNKGCLYIRISEISHGYLYNNENYLTYLGDDGKIIDLPINLLEFSVKRRGETGIEIYLKNRKSYLFVFPSTEDRDSFAISLPQCHNINQKQKQWEDKSITTYEFLIWLNILSTRSFHDARNYPIFPFMGRTLDSVLPYESRCFIKSYLSSIYRLQPAETVLNDAEQQTELSPEFFCLPHVFNHIKLLKGGKSNNFVFAQRRNLEKSSSIHNWMNITFNKALSPRTDYVFVHQTDDELRFQKVLEHSSSSKILTFTANDIETAVLYQDGTLKRIGPDTFPLPEGLFPFIATSRISPKMTLLRKKFGVFSPKNSNFFHVFTYLYNDDEVNWTILPPVYQDDEIVSIGVDTSMTIVTGSKSRSVITWDMSKQRPVAIMKEHKGAVTELVISTTLGITASVDEENFCIISVISTGKVLHTRQLQNKVLKCIKISNGGFVVFHFIDELLVTDLTLRDVASMSLKCSAICLMELFDERRYVVAASSKFVMILLLYDLSVIRNEKIQTDADKEPKEVNVACSNTTNLVKIMYSLERDAQMASGSVINSANYYYNP